MFRLARELGSAFATYVEIGWWGLVSPRSERKALVVVQAVVRSEKGILLAIRSDLRGWELPGGTLELGERCEGALCREVREETGYEVEITAQVGDYVRTGFRPHTARIYTCKVVGGKSRLSTETRALRWVAEDALPDTLFPWYRAPIEDALAADREPVERTERQGIRTILQAIAIDLRMRTSGDRAA